MTTFDRFDPFERRISEAIDEVAAARLPVYLDDILRQTARTAQRPRWTFPERWISMNRRTFQIAAALTVVVMAVGAVGLFSVLGNKGPGTSVPTPSPSSSPSARPSLPPEAVVPPPDTVWGDWIADVDEIHEINMPAGMIQLSIDWERGDEVWLQTIPDYRQLLSSAPLSAPGGELRLRSNPVNNQCPSGSEGRYRWDRSEDGLFLTVELIEDACADRATVFARTWVRSLGAVHDGGAGVAYATTPMTQVTLPRGQRLGTAAGDGWEEIKTFGDLQPFQAFVVVRNPGGYGAPCSTGDTLKHAIPATTADFISYLEGLPGATLTTATTEIDGRPAIQIDYRIDNTVVCEAGEIAALHPEDPSDETVWASVPGELQRMYIVQIDESTTFLLWYQGNSETERAVIDSIRFIDQLPTP